MPDPPELIRHIKKYHPNVKFLYPEMSFWKGIVEIFPPHRRARWCCNIIKEKPGRIIPLVHRILGIRAEESSGRAKQGWINKRSKKQINYHPIFDWLEWEIWEYIERYNLPYCELYDQGFSRIGCVVCPLRIPSKQHDLYMERYPQFFKRFEKQCEKWWDNGGWWRQNKRRSEMLFDEFLANWYGKNRNGNRAK
jgi:phosphoadenosine phosphosulfate reductase